MWYKHNAETSCSHCTSTAKVITPIKFFYGFARDNADNSCAQLGSQCQLCMFIWQQGPDCCMVVHTFSANICLLLLVQHFVVQVVVLGLTLQSVPPLRTQASSSSQHAAPWQIVSGVCAIAMLLCNMHRNTFTMLLPLMADGCSFTLQQQGMLHASMLVGYLAGQLPAGQLADKFGGDRCEAVPLKLCCLILFCQRHYYN